MFKKNREEEYFYVKKEKRKKPARFLNDKEKSVKKDKKWRQHEKDTREEKYD